MPTPLSSPLAPMRLAPPSRRQRSNVSHGLRIVGRIKAPNICNNWSKGLPLRGESLPKCEIFFIIFWATSGAGRYTAVSKAAW